MLMALSSCVRFCDMVELSTEWKGIPNMYAIFLIAVGFITGTLLALPAALPELRRPAQKHPPFRNRLRSAMAVVTLLLLFVGLSWGLTYLQSPAAPRA
jgi:hypothetical protein